MRSRSWKSFLTEHMPNKVVCFLSPTDPKSAEIEHANKSDHTQRRDGSRNTKYWNGADIKRSLAKKSHFLTWILVEILLRDMKTYELDEVFSEIVKFKCRSD
jgi:hypothetical protein